jgi:DNA-binding MarR family transcriptional regulator
MLRWGVATFETPLFGDVLALARERWVREMASRLAALGYDDYRRSDAFAMRLLASGPHALGAFARPLGRSRQAARKIVTGLVERGFVSLEADPVDARRRRVQLTTSGEEYARVVTETLAALNHELSQKVDPHDLATAISVLTFVKDGFAT